MASLFTLEQRSKYTSVIGMIWTVGAVCGPVIGGGFAEVSWVGYKFCVEPFKPLLTTKAWNLLAKCAIGCYQFRLGRVLHAQRGGVSRVHHGQTQED